jgi:hypothetical protein
MIATVIGAVIAMMFAEDGDRVKDGVGNIFMRFRVVDIHFRRLAKAARSPPNGPRVNFSRSNTILHFIR